MQIKCSEFVSLREYLTDWTAQHEQSRLAHKEHLNASIARAGARFEAMLVRQEQARLAMEERIRVDHNEANAQLEADHREFKSRIHADRCWMIGGFVGMVTISITILATNGYSPL